MLIAVGARLASGGQPSNPIENATPPRHAEPESAVMASRVEPMAVKPLANLHGLGIQGTNGERLGKIADLVVDVRVGEIPYVLVASPTAPAEGYRLRLVPTAALKLSARGTEFTVPFQSLQWRNLESIDARELAAGALNTFEAYRHQMARRFGLAGAETAPSPLLLATHLRGKALRHDGDTLGRIDAILAAADRRRAVALVAAADASPARTFLVPMQRLQLPSPQADHFTTTLTRSELERQQVVNFDVTRILSAVTELDRIIGTSGLAQSSVKGQAGFSSASTAAAGSLEPPGVPLLDAPAIGVPAGVNEAERLTPTGRSSDEANTERLQAALAAVRRALASDPAVPTADLKVEILEGRLVLGGLVQDSEIRGRVEHLAREAVPEAPLDNRIIVVPPR